MFGFIRRKTRGFAVTAVDTATGKRTELYATGVREEALRYLETALHADKKDVEIARRTMDISGRAMLYSWWSRTWVEITDILR